MSTSGNGSRLWTPDEECPHPDNALRGTFNTTGDGDIAVICLACYAAWDETFIPLDLLERVTHMIVTQTNARPEPRLDKRKGLAT